MDANSLDAVEIAGLFSSARAVCDAILTTRKDVQHYSNGSTVSDEWIACDAYSSQAGNTTPMAAIAATLVAGGRSSSA